MKKSLLSLRPFRSVWLSGRYRWLKAFSLPPARSTAGSVLLCLGMLWTAAQGARAQNTAVLTTLYSFTNGSDGASPSALVEGRDGNFYGTANGGDDGVGTVFRVTPQGEPTTLYSFTGGVDDGAPNSGLVEGTDGNFYGTTYGVNGHAGTVFRLTPAGVLTTLHSFSGSDGDSPLAGLVQGSDGNFYGTTSLGGANFDGTVFRVTPAGAFTLLHSFGGTDFGDGFYVYAGLVQGSDGNFYGATSAGGSGGGGTVFKITPAGALTTLCSLPTSSGNQIGTLALGRDGNFYGVSYSDGYNANDAGSVFQVTPAGVLTVLHTFDGSDGYQPNAPLVQGGDGNLYGTTAGSGIAGSDGTVFQITPAGMLTTLYRFTGGIDGAYPATLIQGSDGSLHGTAGAGGADADGTIFNLYIPPTFFTGQAALANGVYYPLVSRRQLFRLLQLPHGCAVHLSLRSGL